MEQTLRGYLQAFVRRKAIPKSAIKKGIEAYYQRTLLDDRVFRCVPYYFESCSTSSLNEGIAVADVSGISIPEQVLHVLYEEARHRDCLYLASRIAKLQGDHLGHEPMTADQATPQVLPIDVISRRAPLVKEAVQEAGGNDYIERTTSYEGLGLEHTLARLSESVEERNNIIQQQYQTYADYEGITWVPYIGNFVPFFGAAKRIYAATGIAPHENIVHQMYQRLLTCRDGLTYNNGLSGLLWLREISGIPPSQEIAEEAFHQMANLAFGLRDPKQRFTLLEKITGLKTADVFVTHEMLRGILSRVYLDALCDNNSEKIAILEQMTGIPASLTPRHFQQAYQELFLHTSIGGAGLEVVSGLESVCKRYNSWKIKPVDGFFAAFLYKYAGITSISGLKEE
ncbi:hypothetical protein HZB02_04040 [Candidatus Woesearchaeota archaeon]|nr:hypothetical protein [Candidatus Woesearchaeota archaeon]